MSRRLTQMNLKNFVNMVRELEVAKGAAASKGFSPGELEYRKFQKKSIVAAHDLKAGTNLQKTDINFLRADELGIPPNQADKILNRVIKHDISAHQVINEDHMS